MSLLRDIDSSIIERSNGVESVEETFLDGIARLSYIHTLRRRGACYIYDDERLLPLVPVEEPSEDLRPLLSSAAVDRLARKPDHPPLVLERGGPPDGLLDQLPETETILLQPIYHSGDRLFALLVFTDDAAPEVSVLPSDAFMTSVTTVARQLSIAYSHFLRTDREERTNALWRLFLEADLAPTRCFKDLAVMAQQACPPFGPLEMEVAPEVQILVLKRTPDGAPHFLTIRGTTGAEPSNTNIDIKRSISGLLVEKDPDELPYFCDDPRRPEYRGVYRSYLGVEKGAEIKTELAVRLVTPDDDARFVGILNLESEAENAFNVHHRAAILELASFIAPMVEVFEDRINHNREMQRSVSSVTGEYLDTLAQIFRHGIASPLVAFQGEVTAARRIVEERLLPTLQSGADSDDGLPATYTQLEAEAERLTDVVAALSKVHSQVDEFTSDFARDISGFGRMGRFNLHQLVEETVSLARRSHLTPTESSLSISIEGEQEAFVFCSLLFKQHLFSLFTNAIYSVQEKIDEVPGPGLIEVTIGRPSEPDKSQEVQLNRRWTVAIRDNGVGVSEETLEKLRKFEPGPRNHFRKGAPGQGLGLVAMQRYMGSVGGWIELDSELGEFFEARLLFDEYREDIHGPLSTHRQGADNGA